LYDNTTGEAMKIVAKNGTTSERFKQRLCDQNRAETDGQGLCFRDKLKQFGKDKIRAFIVSRQ
jgi:hypothetical protein